MGRKCYVGYSKGGWAENGHTPSVTRKLSALPPVPAPKRHLGVIRIETPPWAFAPGLTSHGRGSCPAARCHARVQQEISSERRASMIRLGMSGLRKKATRSNEIRQGSGLFQFSIFEQVLSIYSPLKPKKNVITGGGESLPRP